MSATKIIAAIGAGAILGAALVLLRNNTKSYYRMSRSELLDRMVSLSANNNIDEADRVNSILKQRFPITAN